MRPLYLDAIGHPHSTTYVRGSDPNIERMFEAFEAMREALEQTVNALEAFHRDRPEGEGLAYPMMRQARAALALADAVSKVSR